MGITGRASAIAGATVGSNEEGSGVERVENYGKKKLKFSFGRRQEGLVLITLSFAVVRHDSLI